MGSLERIWGIRILWKPMTGCCVSGRRSNRMGSKLINGIEGVGGGLDINGILLYNVNLHCN